MSLTVKEFTWWVGWSSFLRKLSNVPCTMNCILKTIRISRHINNMIIWCLWKTPKPIFHTLFMIDLSYYHLSRENKRFLAGTKGSIIRILTKLKLKQFGSHCFLYWFKISYNKNIIKVLYSIFLKLDKLHTIYQNYSI